MTSQKYFTEQEGCEELDNSRNFLTHRTKNRFEIKCVMNFQTSVTVLGHTTSQQLLSSVEDLLWLLVSMTTPREERIIFPSRMSRQAENCMCKDNRTYRQPVWCQTPCVMKTLMLDVHKKYQYGPVQSELDSRGSIQRNRKDAKRFLVL